jgi:mono/diheme cytochrome c family protein
MKSILILIGFGLLLSCQSTAPNLILENSSSGRSVQLDIEAGTKLYQSHCSACHGANRLGVSAPALIPETLNKLKKADAALVIGDGRPATQMQAYKEILSPAQIAVLAEYIYQPFNDKVSWNKEQVLSSRIIYENEQNLKKKPQFKADPWNLFFVVSHGDRGLTVLDGDKFNILAKFNMRPGLHGGIKYTSDGRYAFAVTRDGWLTKIDVYNLKVVGEIRIGLNTRNIAISSDGKYLLAGNLLPSSLTLIDVVRFEPVKVVDVRAKDGNLSRVSAVYTAHPRKSFVIALKDSAEIWEMPYDLNDEGTVKFKIDDPLDDFIFSPDYKNVFGTTRDTVNKQAQLIDLDLKKPVKSIQMSGLPHLASGITWSAKGRSYMATPNIKENAVMIFDLSDWSLTAKVLTDGPGFFLRSHENSPYAWTDNFLGKNKDLVHVINKETLQVAKVLKPAPGLITAHTEFTRDGKKVLLSVWDDDGAIIVYDSKTLREEKRIPMKKPSGKYNIYNKTHLSEGTSH